MDCNELSYQKLRRPAHAPLSPGIVAKIIIISIQLKRFAAVHSASMQRSNKLLRLFIALFINEKDARNEFGEHNEKHF